jgi:hypothetical protein
MGPQTMRTILKLTGVAASLLVVSAAPAAAQTASNPAAPQLTNVAPPTAKPPGPAGGCMPGYAQDQQAVHEALQKYAGDVAAQERAIAAIPCLKVAAHSTAPDPATARTVKPPR